MTNRNDLIEAAVSAKPKSAMTDSEMEREMIHNRQHERREMGVVVLVIIAGILVVGSAIYMLCMATR